MLDALASSEFSTSSLMTALTEAMTWELDSKWTVSLLSCWRDMMMKVCAPRRQTRVFWREIWLLNSICSTLVQVCMLEPCSACTSSSNRRSCQQEWLQRVLPLPQPFQFLKDVFSSTHRPPAPQGRRERPPPFWLVRCSPSMECIQILIACGLITASCALPSLHRQCVQTGDKLWCCMCYFVVWDVSTSTKCLDYTCRARS